MSKTYEPEEKQRYLEEFRKGNDSLYIFAKKHNMPPSTLRGWIKEERNSKFGSVNMEAAPIIAEEKVTNENMLLITENIKIEIKSGYNKMLLKNVMEAFLN